MNNEPLNLTKLIDDFFNRPDEEVQADMEKMMNHPDFIALQNVPDADFLMNWLNGEED